MLELSWHVPSLLVAAVDLGGVLSGVWRPLVVAVFVSFEVLPFPAKRLVVALAARWVIGGMGAVSEDDAEVCATVLSWAMEVTGDLNELAVIGAAVERLAQLGVERIQGNGELLEWLAGLKVRCGGLEVA
jgi:hypothetical protein